MKQAQNWQKSYTDQKRHDLEFEVNDHVFVEIVPYQHVMRFSRKEKLTLWHIGSYEIIERIDKVAYWLALLTSMRHIHNVFHVSLLHKCLNGPSQVFRLNDMELKMV